MYIYVYVAMFVCTYTYTCIECTCKTDTDYTLASHHDLTVKLALCVIETCSAHHTYLMVCYNNVVAMQEVISPMVPNTTPGLTEIFVLLLCYLELGQLRLYKLMKFMSLVTV